MRRFLPIVAFLFLSLARVASALTVMLPEDPAQQPMELRDEEVTVDVEGPVARTSVRETFFSPNPNVVEGFFLFTLPTNAQMSDFVIKLDDKELVAETLDKDKAQQVYTGIVQRMKDPGLLEFLNDRTFRARIYPIQPQKEFSLQISYMQTLGRTGGLMQYDYDGAGARPESHVTKSSMKLNLKGAGGLRTITSPTHPVEIKRADDNKSATVSYADFASTNTRFTLLFDEENKEGVGLDFLTYRAAGSDKGTFLLMLSPTRSAKMAKAMPKDVLFVLDVSGSMGDEGKLDKARAALQQCLSALSKKDRFDLIKFSSGVEKYEEVLLPATNENIAKARDWVADLRPTGGTNIEGALTAALDLMNANKGTNPLRQIIFMTDGLPTVGEKNAVKIYENSQKNSHESLRIFTVGFGYDVNTALLDSVAEQSRALAAYVHPGQEIETALTTLFDSISHAVLTDLKVDIDGVKVTETYPTKIPDLFPGQELMVLGTYEGDGPATAKVTGKAADEDYSQQVKVNFPKQTDRGTKYVRAIWAQRKVASLLSEIRRNGESKELRDEVTALAKEFNLPTPYTSYLAAPDVDRDYMISSGMMSQRMRGAFTYDPTNGTVSDGDVYRVKDGAADLSMASGSIGSGSSGAMNVRAAEKLQVARNTTNAYMPRQSIRQLQSDGLANADRRNFQRNAAGQWEEEGLQNAQLSKPVVKIKYLSNAYFALIRKYPERNESILLSDNVALLINDLRVQIGADGIEEELPDGL
ncbi:hypothetical protein BH09SUM1_BH09SUM1_06360 [soil metagenome]